MSFVTKINWGKAWSLPGLFLFFVVLAVVVVAGGFAPTHNAYAQQGGDVSSRLNRLENEVSTLGRAVYRGEVPQGASPLAVQDAGVNADMQLRIQNLEDQIRVMNGRIEELSYENQQLRDSLDRALQDMQLRMQDLEQRGVSPGASADPAGQVYGRQSAGNVHATDFSGEESGAESSASGEASAQKQTLGVLSSGGSDAQASATAHYESAFSQLKQGSYDNAQAGFGSFLKAHPKHQLAGNAQYWLGETFYARGQYDQAARVFAEGFSKYPDSSKGADNLLKLGISLAAMGKNSDACTALTQLPKQFPNGAQSVLRRGETEMQRLGC